MTGKKSCLSLHSNRTNSYLFINGIEVVKFKAKDSEINPILLCLGKILKDFSIDHMEKAGLNRYLCDFSYNYNYNYCSWWYIRYSKTFIMFNEIEWKNIK